MTCGFIVNMARIDEGGTLHIDGPREDDAVSVTIAELVPVLIDHRPAESHRHAAEWAMRQRRPTCLVDFDRHGTMTAVRLFS